MRSMPRSTRRLTMNLETIDTVSEMISSSGYIASHLDALLHNSLVVAEEVVAPVAQEAVSIYSKVDKTGFIGGLADIVEQAIDFGRNLLKDAGVQNSYGFSIILFTILVKALTLPLTTKQLESTSKMQKLTPLQQKVQAAYANDEQMKNQMLAKLFEVAQVNPLAGCLPALVQIPIFISLYRAIQNLIAENKLNEPFLWIPDLEGPVYMSGPATSMDWIKSVFTGSPALGWPDTLAFMSLPVILFISQTISQKILQPPKDPNRVMTEPEQVTQGFVNNLPFIVAFFSLNVPAGLAVYWIANNLLTTVVTIAVKNQFKDDKMPAELDEMMAAIEADIAGRGGRGAVRGPSAGQRELRTGVVEERRPKKEGFGFAPSSAIDVEQVSATPTQSEVTVTEPITASEVNKPADPSSPAVPEPVLLQRDEQKKSKKGGKSSRRGR